MEEKKKAKYYSANGLLGRGALFNQVYSTRSDGKTFDCKYRALQRFLKYGYSSVYVRRWKNEFSKPMCETFFNEVFKVYPKLYEQVDDLRGDRTGIQIKKRGEPWKYAEYFVPISVSGKLKSNLDTTWIREIDFDEYIPLDGRYVQDEMKLLIEFWRSCDRERYIVKLLTLGNKVSSINPFLTFFGIKLDINKPKLRTYKDGALAIEVYQNEERLEGIKESQFMKLIEGTQYEDYAFGGVLDEISCIIEPMPKYAHPFMSFMTIDGRGSIYEDGNGNYWITETFYEDQSIIIVDKPYGYYKDKERVATESGVKNWIMQTYRCACLYCTSEVAWSKFLPIAKLIAVK